MGSPWVSRGSSRRRLLECVCASTGRLSVCCHHHHLVPPHGVAMPLVTSPFKRCPYQLPCGGERYIMAGLSCCAMLVLGLVHGWSYPMGGELISYVPPRNRCLTHGCLQACVVWLQQHWCTNMWEGGLAEHGHPHTPELAILDRPDQHSSWSPTMAGCCGRAAGGCICRLC
jgi:hypothetical protein